MSACTSFLDRGDPGAGKFAFTSDAERERRMAELRRRMSADGFDALIITGRSDLRFRGRVLWTSDIFQFTADCFVVILGSGPPVFVTTPVVGLGQALRTTWVEDFRMHGRPGTEVGRVIADAGLSKSRIGIVGLRDSIAAAHLEEIVSVLPGAGLNDATELFELARQVKSAEELENLRQTSSIFRKVFAAIDVEIRPGTSEADVAGCAARSAKLHGCRDIKTAMAMSPFEAVSYGSPKRIARDGVAMVWVESPGPTGYWLELRRSYTFGQPSETVRRYWDVVKEFWDVALRQLRPGATGNDVMGHVKAVVEKAGFKCSDSNYSIHGIGTDAIEGMWYPGNDRVFKANEVISFHPAVVIDDAALQQQVGFLGMTDNILITEAGGERLTYVSDDIVSL